MDKALLLHGRWWNANGNWFPWLKKELYKKLFEVYVPNLPDTDNPVLKEQLEYLDAYISDFKEAWLIVWHSLWCKLAMKFIEENNIKDSIVVLVAPVYLWLTSELWKDTFGDSYDNLDAYFDALLDFWKLNELNNKYVVFLSDNDDYINLENAKQYYSELREVEFREFKGKWHFNEWSWVLELEEVLDYI